MSDCLLHVGDVGTVIVVTITEDHVALDISGASEKTLIFRRPDETAGVVVEGAFTTDGTEGKLQYTVPDGFLDTPGRWAVEARLTIGAWTGRTARAYFTVREPIPIAD